jgi:hypothetical protein
MSVLDGAGFPVVPADQIEAAGLGVGAVGDDAEVARRIAVAQQLALASQRRGETASFF